MCWQALLELAFARSADVCAAAVNDVAFGEFLAGGDELLGKEGLFDVVLGSADNRERPEVGPPNIEGGFTLISSYHRRGSGAEEGGKAVSLD